MTETTPESSTPKLDTGVQPAASPAPLVAPASTEVAVRPLADPQEPKNGWWWGTGRRKAAVARVRVKPGSGDFKIAVSRNKTKTVEEYFSEARDRGDCYAPLDVTNTRGKLDVVVNVSGGGYMGQAGAVLLGLSRALKGYDPSLEHALREHGYLTRDPREVERKKYGQAGARRRFQFSKR
ncbi:MAG: 30S ribosomal protein S9 [Phycisphaeraceae bacterium]|nr:30S ribosomal protein S9 [Phycisphaeraceae bacterium]MCB9847086.1 30S ribosomal protein S9 [Phycisphaeraceae bacterium]